MLGYLNMLELCFQFKIHITCRPIDLSRKLLFLIYKKIHTVNLFRYSVQSGEIGAISEDNVG